MWVGADLLSYTEDDEQLPDFGNPGGTWTSSALDVNNDGMADRRFTTARQNDDDMQTYASNSEFHYGVIAEAEDWHDFHNADNTGPCFSCDILDLDECVDAGEIPGVDCCQQCNPANDFEHNDGLSDWEERTNWYWYNNAWANQRGLGGSKYYFEWKDAIRNPGYFDEVQGWRKGIQFQRNHDNGSLPQKRFARGYDVTIRGLFIPVDHIEDLQKGDLDALFGWYDGDMAEYVRDVLLPRLDDPALTIFETGIDCTEARLPAVCRRLT